MSAATEIGSIAIVGMSGRFPGARTLAGYWQNLAQGVESIRTFSDDELLAAGIDRALVRDPAFVKAGAVLDDIERFDAAFFGISPREAETMDPQHRFFLECAWEALEDAGIVPDTASGRVGVFGGAGASQYLLHHLHDRLDLGRPTVSLPYWLGNDKDSLATRVSYKLNLKGPSLAIQTACSTSLVAVCVACQSLQNYQCDVALAGGVHIAVPQTTGYLFEPGLICSPDGHCRAFDARAQGTVPGNGVGVVVLKRLGDALADGDRIRAVIRGAAVNNDGAAKVGFTAPSVTGQAEVIVAALAAAEVPADSISYVEAHGTGTAIGDPIEIAALTQAFRESTRRTAFCALGSVKTNIGHLIEAAGIAGLIKTVLALEHRQLPPSLHFESPNPEIDFAASPFFVNRALSTWTSPAAPRRAGVSSFGLGGTNAHLILEEAPAPGARPAVRPEDARSVVLPLSARSPQALADLVAAYREFLSQEGRSHPIEAICATAALRRKHHEHRVTVVGRTHDEIRGKLAELLPGASAPALLSSPASASPPAVTFVFPGQGSQWLGMGRQLLEREPVFREALEECEQATRPFLEWSLLTELRAEEASSGLGRIDVVQPVLFAIQVALAALWRSWGIEPTAVVGHSMGEIAAAQVAGALPLPEAARIICRRSQLLRRLSGQGAMLLVELTPTQAEAAIQAWRAQVAIAACNSPSTTVLSGDPAALEALAAGFERAGIAHFRIKVNVASHSPQVDPLRQELLTALAGVSGQAPRIPVFSTVAGRSAGAAAFDAAYWADNLRQPVLFAAAIDRLLDAGCRTFVELSPHPVLLTSVDDTARARSLDCALLPSLRRDEDESAILLESLGRLHARGCRVAWTRRHPDPDPPVPLPAYPWQRERYWVPPVRPRFAVSAERHQGRATALEGHEPSGGAAAAGPSAVPQPASGRGACGLADPAICASTAALEAELAKLWREVLGVGPGGRDDSFFLRGGDSLAAMRLLARVREQFGKRIPFAIFVLAPTVAGLAARLEGGDAGLLWSPLVPIQPAGTRRPFFCVTPIMGTAFPYYELARQLGREQPFFALQPRGLCPGDAAIPRMAALAEYYTQAVRAVQPTGPYQLGGWSFGATVAFAMACQLERQGLPVAGVTIIDTPARVPTQRLSLREGIGFYGGTVLGHLWPYVRQLHSAMTTEADPPPRGAKPFLSRQRLFLSAAIPLLRVATANTRAHLRYRPGPYQGAVTLLRTEVGPRRKDSDPTWGWNQLAPGRVAVRKIPGNHMTLLQEPHVAAVAGVLRDCLR